MATRPSRPKSAAASAAPASLSARPHARAPFGFVFLFLLLVATFVFATFFVVSQTAREQMVRREALENSQHVLTRVDALQVQVNVLSGQVAALSGMPETSTSTSTTLPTAQDAR